MSFLLFLAGQILATLEGLNHICCSNSQDNEKNPLQYSNAICMSELQVCSASKHQTLELQCEEPLCPFTFCFITQAENLPSRNHACCVYRPDDDVYAQGATHAGAGQMILRDPKARLRSLRFGGNLLKTGGVVSGL